MLWESELEESKILTATQVSDGRGGVNTTYTEGETIIKACFSFDSSAERTAAEKETSIPLYIITTHKDVILPFHTIIKRVGDGQLFRVTSESADNKTPGSTTLNMRQVNAELWGCNNGQNTGS